MLVVIMLATKHLPEDISLITLKLLARIKPVERNNSLVINQVTEKGNFLAVVVVLTFKFSPEIILLASLLSIFSISCA